MPIAVTYIHVCENSVQIKSVSSVDSSVVSKGMVSWCGTFGVSKGMVWWSSAVAVSHFYYP